MEFQLIKLGISSHSGHAHGCFTLWILSVLFLERGKKSRGLLYTQRTKLPNEYLQQLVPRQLTEALFQLFSVGTVGGGLLTLQGHIIISRVRAGSFLCLPEVAWNKKLRNTAEEPLYNMSLLAYVQSKELAVVAWIFTELRNFMRLYLGPVGSEYNDCLPGLWAWHPLSHYHRLTLLLTRPLMLKAFPLACVNNLDRSLCHVSTF